jgi:cell wall-active antibiotic response 4TMS protein YvqF
MKMGTGIIWGILLVLVGFGLIIKVVFNVDFPLFKIIFALFIIYLGLKLLFGSFNIDFNFRGNANDVIFAESVFFDIDDREEYNIVFGKGVFDLRDYNLLPGKNKLKVNTLFAGTKIILPKDISVRIKAESVFGNSSLPDGSNTGFGSTYYTSENFDESKDHLVIYTDVVFGGVDIYFK